MKILSLFTDSTHNNSFTDLTQGQLHIAVTAIIIFAICGGLWIKKEMKVLNTKVD